MAQGKRKLADRVPRSERPKKRIRKQHGYHSSSDEEENEPGFAPVNLNDSDGDDDRDEPTATALRQKSRSKTKPKSAVHNLESSSEDEAADESQSEPEPDYLSDDDDNIEDDEDGRNGHKKSKRNDPDAFSTSMSKILSTKLSQSTRTDPVLARSKEAAQASSERAHERLEQKAKAKIKADKKEDLDRGRNKDVLGIQRGIAGEVAEEETKLRKIATRGVIQLFNAFHAAHVRAEQAAKEERQKGTIGMDSREEMIKEKSKQGFLELIGGKKKEKV